LPHIVEVPAGQIYFTVGWQRRKSKDDEWILSVSPSDLPNPFDRLRGKSSIAATRIGGHSESH